MMCMNEHVCVCVCVCVYDKQTKKETKKTSIFKNKSALLKGKIKMAAAHLGFRKTLKSMKRVLRRCVCVCVCVCVRVCDVCVMCVCDVCVMCDV